MLLFKDVMDLFSMRKILVANLPFNNSDQRDKIVAVNRSRNTPKVQMTGDLKIVS